MNTLPITARYAIPLAILFLILWMDVTRTRGATKVSIGHNDDAVLHERIRRHGNFIEWVPMVLLLLGLAEAQGADAIYLHVTGVLLVFGRLVHPFGLRASQPTHVLRIVGNSANILATINVIICLVVKGLGY